MRRMRKERPPLASLEALWWDAALDLAVETAETAVCATEDRALRSGALRARIATEQWRKREWPRTSSRSAEA